MRLQIAARHMQLTDALREHVRHRFLDTLPSHYDRDSCELRVEIDHPVGRAKRRYEEVHAQLTVPGGLLVSHGRAKDVFAAVDAAQKQLLRRLDEWHRRVHMGSRFPRKYYAARLVEEGALPASLPSPDEPEPSILPGGAAATDAITGLRGAGLPEGLSGEPAVPPPHALGEHVPVAEVPPLAAAVAAVGLESPTEALEAAIEDALTVPPPHKVPRALLDLLASRRSVRRFRAAPVPDDLLHALEVAVTLAPSASNLEARRFWFVREPRLRRMLARATRGQAFVADAPLVVVCCAHLGSASILHRRGTELYAPMDVAASIENLLLTAHAARLGAVWIGELDEAEVALVLGLPPEVRPLAMVAVGWPAERPAEPAHLPQSELVHEL